MARSKAKLDPVQAARKAAQGREAKRNKERKDQAQEARTLRQDTSSLERQIHRLETRSGKLSEDEQQQLAELKADLHRIQRIKQDYVAKNPDQRDFVRGFETKVASKVPAQPAAPAPKAQHTQRDPRWSIYYDATFNPYGAAPPGMPYLEKPYEQLVAEGLVPSDVQHQPPLPDESEPEDESESDDDHEEIELPKGDGGIISEGESATDSDSSIDDDLKDIIMPQDPPPSRSEATSSAVPLPSDPTASSSARVHHNYRGRDGSRGHGPAQGRGRGRGRGNGPSAHLPVRPPPATEQLPGNTSSTTPTSLPSRPAAGPAVISAAPQLRDLRQEATVFMPASIRKKQSERAKPGLTKSVDPAPETP